MYKVEMYLRVRRACFVEGMSAREAARVYGLHRDTVRKMLKPELPISNRLDQGNAPSSTRAIVVLLTNAVNLPIKLTNPSSGVLNWCSMGSGGGFHYVCTRFELPQARTSPLVAPLHL